MYHTSSRCIICNEAHAKPFCVKNNREYVSCTVCRHVYVQDPLAESEITQYYANRTSHHASADKKEWDYSPTKEKLVYRPQLQRLAKLGKAGRILDIGCSNGSFLSAAKKYGWDGYGIELEKNSYELAQKHGVKVYNQQLSQQAFPDEHFSAITLWQVIEHLPDPKTVIKEIVRILQPGGIFAVSTPNIRSIGWILLREEWDAVEPEVHLNLFEPKNLARLITDCGLRTRHLETVDLKPSTVKKFIRKLSKKEPDKKTDSVANLAKSLSDKKMSALLTFRHLVNLPLKSFGIGEDIYAYFVK